MIKRLISLAIILQIIFPNSSVMAQSPMTFSNMVINIWPEYDRPGVLVFYKISLAPTTVLPAKLTLRMPKTADEIFSVKMKDNDGRFEVLQVTTEPDGEWIKVTFTTPVPDIQLEYYDSIIIEKTGRHEYLFTWPGDSNIRNASVIIQEPLTAEEFEIEPDMGSGRTNADGLTYFESTLGELKTGSPYNITIQYNKSGSNLSAPAQSVAPAEPITPSTFGWQTFNQFLPYLLGGLGILLILAGGYWYWRSGINLVAAFRRRNNPSKLKEPGGENITYCHRCGRKAKSGDEFCRSCGTKLHTE